LYLAVLVATVGFVLSARAAETKEVSPEPMNPLAPVKPVSIPQTANAPLFRNLSDLKWEKILPDLGENSPEICFLHVDPTTHATQLLIRAPKAIHIRKHWHSANETHMIITGTVTFECEGKRAELGPGSFNYMPAKTVHEAWLPGDSLTFITVDGPWDVNWVEGPPTAADLTK
jgi:mannose-6-phosphate isomerase-like protein (cupin superfamily)